MPIQAAVYAASVCPGRELNASLMSKQCREITRRSRCDVFVIEKSFKASAMGQLTRFSEIFTLFSFHFDWLGFGEMKEKHFCETLKQKAD
jgi:hypothetical protein